MWRKLATGLAVMVLGIAWSGPDDRSGSALARAGGPVLLTVSGSIANGNADGVVEFDRATLESLGLRTLTTTTEWTEGPVEFEGVLARDVLDAVGARGTEVMATALNDYAVPLPMAELYRYPVMLALKMNGEYMTIRNKGPIWIVYPRDQFPELHNSYSHKKWVWQLRELSVR